MVFFCLSSSVLQRGNTEQALSTRATVLFPVCGCWKEQKLTFCVSYIKNGYGKTTSSGGKESVCI